MGVGWYELGLITFGAAIGFGFEFARKSTNKRKKNKAVKSLISSEIDANLERLNQYWETIQENKGKEDRDEASPVFRKDKFLQADLPEWSSGFFDKHAVDLAAALPEEQMQNVFEFYTSLSELPHLRKVVINSGPVYLKWSDFSEKIAEVLNAENPIADWCYERRWFRWLLQRNE